MKDIKNVFTPGFTTKKRGWGLGLSLAKRIVEEYHRGRIFVKESEVGVGTTFRIELEKEEKTATSTILKEKLLLACRETAYYPHMDRDWFIIFLDYS